MLTKNLVLVLVVAGSVLCVPNNDAKDKNPTLVANATTENTKPTGEPPVIVDNTIEPVLMLITDKNPTLIANATTENPKATGEPPVIINNTTEPVPEETTIIESTPPPSTTPEPTKPTTSTTPSPTTNTTTKPTVPTSPSTPTTSPSTPTTNTTMAPTKPTTPSTTSTPSTTAAPPHKGRHFDGPSFIGGIILATGLMAIGFVAFKFYRARTERNYHTL